MVIKQLKYNISFSQFWTSVMKHNFRNRMITFVTYVHRLQFKEIFTPINIQT